MSELKRYTPIAEALSILFYPHVEVVIHDLMTQSIYTIFNSFSKRSEGDESLTKDLNSPSLKSNVFPPYLKTNYNGKKIKSVTAVLRNDQKEAIGLFCINLDISKWQEMQQFLRGFLEGETELSNALFQNDWREKINAFVSQYLKKNALQLTSLSRKEKQLLILQLQKEGAFEAKNAATYIADVLSISRASVYNYLKKS